MDLIIRQLEERVRYYKNIKEKASANLSRNKQEGNLRVSKKSGKNCKYQYYLCTKPGDTNGKYIKNKDRNVAVGIAQRDYDKNIIKQTSEWIRWSENMIKTAPRNTMHEICGTNEGRKPLIVPYEISDEDYVKKWDTIPYIGKEIEDGIPEIFTEKGERVRSKSEKLIADKLYMLGIPYKYECPINIRGWGTVYPDFTLLDVKNRKEIILEHFGMMDNSDYASKAVNKINVYLQNGYVQGQNIIFTFETSNLVLNTKNIEKLIKNILKTD